MRRFWITVLVLATVSLVLLATAGTSHANYWGARWPDTKVCVQNRIADPVIKTAMRAAISEYHNRTVMYIPYYGSTRCSSRYDQIIYVTAGDYGRTGWVGRMDHYKRYHWGQTDNGTWTYLFDGPLYVRLNTYYNTYDTVADWQRVAVHELGHALGLNHTEHTCWSVMSLCKSRPKVLANIDVEGSVSHPGVNDIYSW